MLRITPSTSAAGAKKYFTESLTRSDYYIDGQEVAGLWGGKAAERLGLRGEVDAKSYFALCDNLHPETGEQLTPRNKDNRRVGFDFTFSAPKSVSALYELTGASGHSCLCPATSPRGTASPGMGGPAWSESHHRTRERGR
jgi:hypothetical protein